MIDHLGYQLAEARRPRPLNARHRVINSGIQSDEIKIRYRAAYSVYKDFLSESRSTLVVMSA